MSAFYNKLKSYAEIVIRLGINVQYGQKVVIDAPIVAAEFVRLLVECAYDFGAESVDVEWSDSVVHRTKLLRSSTASLEDYPIWKSQGYTDRARQGAAFITVQAPQPGMMKNVPTERVALFQRTSGRALQEYRHYRMTNKVSWVVVALPTQEWAKQVFPALSEELGLSKLWEIVFRVTRADQIDPIGAWNARIKEIQGKLLQLNNAKYRQLHFTSPGTDLTIELPMDHMWIGGGSTTEKGNYFMPNVPTEECFTAPLRTGVNGKVRGTKTLYHGGKLIKDFEITFKQGKVCDFRANYGEDTLQYLFQTDEGSQYLGEVALVPNSTLLAKEGINFFNTLYDENSSCHIAFGSAYPFNLKGGEKMTKEQLSERGINQSIVHVDFMFGSSEMDVSAELPSGGWVKLMKQGEWVT